MEEKMEFEIIKTFKFSLTEKEARKVSEQLHKLEFNSTTSLELWEIYSKLPSY